jgi:hypothetical protein
MSRKTAVLDIEDYRNDLPIAGDYELRVRLNRTWLLGNLSCVVMSYRVHARQVSVSKSIQQLSSNA